MTESSANARSEWPRALFWIAIAFSSFQILMSAFHPLTSQVIRGLHVGFVLLLIFTLYPPMALSLIHI